VYIIAINKQLTSFEIYRMDHQTLDNIADSYIPVLAIIAFFASLLVSCAAQSRFKIVIWRLICLSLLLGIAYGLMFIDNAYAIWPYLGLDHSTHTAVSLVLVLFLVLLIPTWSLLWSCSFVVYCALMLYQQYHSISDILTTALVLCITITIVFLTLLMGGKTRKIRHFEKIGATFPIFRSQK